MSAPYTDLGLDMGMDDEEERRRKLEEGQATEDPYGLDALKSDGGEEGDDAAVQQQRAPAPAAPIQTMAGPAGPTMPPPPPPPPPPPLGVQNLATDISEYARNWMQNPNRYLTDLARTERAAGEARIGAARDDSRRGIEEWAQSRGLLGSSYEGEQVQELESDLDRNRLEQEARLLEMLTTAESLDRASAGNYGLDVAGFEAGQGTANRELDLRAQELRDRAQLEGRSLDLQQSRQEAEREIALEQLGISRDELDMRASQIQQELALEGRTLDLQQARDMAAREFQVGQLQFNERELQVRAQEIADRARLEGRQLDLQQARDMAQQQLAREELQFRERISGDELRQRESEFARSMGLNEREFMAEQDRFARTHAEQVATRLQANDQFRIALQSEEARAAVDAGLREKALQLQAQGLAADQAFRQASLAQERELTENAQRLTELGLTQDQAYRYSALSQDARFREEANRLTQLGLTQEDAYRHAELGFRQKALEQEQAQFEKDLDFRTWLAETDDERFDKMMELWRASLGQGTGTGTGTGGPGGPRQGGTGGGPGSGGPGSGGENYGGGGGTGGGPGIPGEPGSDYGPNGEPGVWIGGRFFPSGG